jgi:parallel beta-helix repeat protein
MSRKLVLLMALIIILVGTLGLAFDVQTVEASGTIYIRANGDVEGTDKIDRVGEYGYIFTDNINDSIVIERDNIMVDGKGYTVQGTGSGTGIHLSGRNNVTVKNMEIRSFERGIQLDNSSNNTISANNVINNEYGIGLYLSSSNNTLRHNDASDNRYNLGIFRESASGYIQDIDDSNTVNGKPVYYWVNRRDMTVPLDAGYVVLVNCTRITVKNLNLTNNMQGVALAFTTNSTITNNNLINNFDGIRLEHSSNNNLISGNNITANTHYGIRSYYNPSAGGGGPSYNITIYGNNITDNGIGIRLYYSSNNTISANNVANNSEEGIGLYGSSSNNTVSGNNIVNNPYGIWFYNSYGNWIYHNNFIDNTLQVYPSFYRNFWDAGYPSGGNYWSPQYDGIDIHSGPYQNETGSDGIGDTLYIQDNYPLMGMFSDFNATSEYHVTTICNSTISDFKFDQMNNRIGFNITGDDETVGFCRICIPHTLFDGNYTVLVDGMSPLMRKTLPASNSTNTFLFFTYVHTTHHVEINAIPPPPGLFISPVSASTGTKIIVNGWGFLANSSVLITLEDTALGYAMTDRFGDFRFAFILDIPASVIGLVTIKAYDGSNYAETAFAAIDVTPLDIDVDVADIYFRGELVEFYAQTRFKGVAVNVIFINAILCKPDGATEVLTAEKVRTGLYKIEYEISGDAPEGTYTLVVESSYVTDTIEADGTNFKCFLLSSTLTNMNATLVDVKNDIATILIPDLGTIRANLTVINAKLDNLNGTTVWIKTNLGLVKTSVDAINAVLVELDGNVVSINSTVGLIQTDIENIRLDVTAINGTTATIETTLGVMNGTVTSIEDDIATILIPDLGQVKADVSHVKAVQEGVVIPQYITFVLALIAAIGAILSVIFLRRRQTTKTD